MAAGRFSDGLDPPPIQNLESGCRTVCSKPLSYRAPALAGALIGLVVAGEAGKRHIGVGGVGEQTILPGFAVSEGVADGINGLSTLDDLAVAMPGLLVAAQSR